VLFNSFLFIYVFLPVTVLGFFLLGRNTRTSALLWLTLASLFFYAWWRPINVLLIAPSILINYGIAWWMQRLQAKEDRRATLLLVVGIVFNVLFLGYFKYRNFFYESVNDVFGADIPLMHLVLPLGISFITFQKIAFLVDVQGGRVDKFTLREYFLFVLFFPQLIAGPIVHYREVMPQFRRISCRFQASEAVPGLTLFVFGLFKKTVLADGISPPVTALFQHAANSGQLSVVAAWMAAVGYTLQLYFDFSGYSDMALGLARIFGIRLPANFNSPLRASNIIDFWRRWHITLTRFLTAYIYNPIVLSLTRRRMTAGKPVLTSAGVSTGTFLTMVVFPTILVMLVSGIWHGAGIKFIIWGFIHGIYLCINHAWRSLPAVHRWRSGKRYHEVMGPVGFVITFLAVVVAMVFFGAPSTAVAVITLKGMAGHGGLDLPLSMYQHLGPLTGFVHALGLSGNTWWDVHQMRTLGGYTALLLALALLSPNSLQVLNWDSKDAPAVTKQPAAKFMGILPVQWQGSIPWASLIAALAIIAVYRIGGPSEFLYWQF
jgi:D-alanyl-lipoteichoic acid acyltransferase DltB (MBOAT superfamily)